MPPGATRQRPWHAKSSDPQRVVSILDQWFLSPSLPLLSPDLQPRKKTIEISKLNHNSKSITIPDFLREGINLIFSQLNLHASLACSNRCNKPLSLYSRGWGYLLFLLELRHFYNLFTVVNIEITTIVISAGCSSEHGVSHSLDSLRHRITII